MSIRVLAVDDSAVAREMLRYIAESAADIELTSAPSAQVARAKMAAKMPDVLLLDLQMPGECGVDFLRTLMADSPLPVVVCSASSPNSTEAKRALDLGAVDIVRKPAFRGGDVPIGERDLILEAIRGAAVSQRATRGVAGVPSVLPPGGGSHHDIVVAIGVSTGGPNALRRVLPRLPVDCPPILIVQHMVAGYTAALAESLDGLSAIQVVEAEEAMKVIPGRAIIAPATQHLELRRGSSGLLATLSSGAKVARHRPSVDVLFHSVAKTMGAHAVAVLLTGMGDDGADGMKALSDAGAYTLAQDEASCAVYGMPRVATERGLVRRQVSLDEMAGAILHHSRQRDRAYG